MNRATQSILMTALLLTIASAAAAQPVIVDLNKTEAPRSGRIAIEGLGFGSDGQVLVAGLPAWTATWTDGRVVAYVPETAPLGPTTVRVVVGGTPSNEVPLTVTTRQSDGRIFWSFEADSTNLWWRPALAPDGTVYIHTNNATDGLVYALSANGGLKWIQKVNWYPYVPPTAGPDGAVYVGSIGTIYRISPEGNIDWQYNPPDGVNIEVSPTIGPDGLLYGAFEISGAFAIEPLTGQLVWSNPGDPLMSSKSGESVEAVFGPSGPGEPVDQFYISMDGGAGFYAFSLDGDQLFTSSFGNIKGTAEVAIGSDGTIYGPRAIGLVVAAVDPSDGNTLWEYYPGASEWATGTNNVEIGPDDMLYFVGSSAKLEAYDPATQDRKWQEFTVLDTLKRPSVTPDGSTLIVTGADQDIYGGPGFVKAFNSGNGHELWRLDLPFELVDDSFRVYGTHHAKITPDNSTAYVSTYSLAQWPYDGDPHTFLYALDLTGNGGNPGSCNDNGACELGENCESCPGDCAGQTNGNPANQWCCGDGVCSAAEDSLMCAVDCCVIPGEVSGVGFDLDGMTLHWDSTGPDVVYDIARQDLAGLITAAPMECLAQGVDALAYTDPAAPAVGDAFYYMVRARNACGVGGWGLPSGSGPRNSTCP